MVSGGLMNGTPTPGHSALIWPASSSNFTGVGVPFINPRSPRARQWSEGSLTAQSRYPDFIFKQHYRAHPTAHIHSNRDLSTSA